MKLRERHPAQYWELTLLDSEPSRIPIRFTQPECHNSGENLDQRSLRLSPSMPEG